MELGALIGSGAGVAGAAMDNETFDAGVLTTCGAAAGAGATGGGTVA